MKDRTCKCAHRLTYKTSYRHIQKNTAWAVWQGVTRNPPCLNLIQLYLQYSTETGGEIFTPQPDILLGCALSPQTGGILLWHMDRYFREQKALFYVRYMDDFLILTRKCWPLRRAIADLNNYLNLEGFESHPDKTQTGRLLKSPSGCRHTAFGGLTEIAA